MKRKMTWFSYLLWLVYVCLIGVLLDSCLSAWLADSWSLAGWQAGILVLLIFVAVSVIWMTGRRLSASFWEKRKAKKDETGKREDFLALCIFGGAALYRIFLMVTAYSVSSMDWGGLGRLLLQLIALAGFSFAVRILVGSTEALCAGALLAFSPVFGEALFRQGLDCVYLFLFVICLLLLGVYANIVQRKEWTKRASLLLSIFGVSSGVLGCFDPAGWSLFFLGGALCVSTGIRRKNQITQVAVRLGLMMASGLAAVVILLCLVAVVSGRTITWLLMNWWEINGLWISPPFLFAAEGGVLAPGATLLTSTLSCLLGALAAVGFWFGKQQRQNGWILLLLSLILADTGVTKTVVHSLLLVLVWSVLAGMGIASMLSGDTEKEKAEKFSGTLGWVDLDADETPEQSISDFQVEEITGDKPLSPSADPVKNPPPLREKPGKEQQEYDRKIEEEELEFDYPVDDEDDFDV